MPSHYMYCLGFFTMMITLIVCICMFILGNKCNIGNIVETHYWKVHIVCRVCCLQCSDSFWCFFYYSECLYFVSTCQTERPGSNSGWEITYSNTVLALLSWHSRLSRCPTLHDLFLSSLSMCKETALNYHVPVIFFPFLNDVPILVLYNCWWIKCWN